MKTLLLLRHAKSDRTNPTLRDHDRPLAMRGEADAPRIGIALAVLALIPDDIITSTAVRARDTAHLVADAIAYHKRIVECNDVYDASVTALLHVLRQCNDAHETVLLVGHNPGLEELVSFLTSGENAHPVARVPTAALARLSLDIKAWSAVDAACGHLELLLTPRTIQLLIHARDDTKD